MQWIVLSISITLLAVAILFISVVTVSPNFVKELMSQNQPVQEEVPVFLQDFEYANKNENSHTGSSAWILGDNTETKPTQTSKQLIQQTYQSPAPLPTIQPTQEPVAQQAQEQNFLRMAVLQIKRHIAKMWLIKVLKKQN